MLDVFAKPFVVRKTTEYFSARGCLLAVVGRSVMCHFHVSQHGAPKAFAFQKILLSAFPSIMQHGWERKDIIGYSSKSHTAIPSHCVLIRLLASNLRAFNISNKSKPQTIK